MAWVSDKIIFYHIPKTGGVWVWNILLMMGIKIERINAQRVGVRGSRVRRQSFGLYHEHNTYQNVGLSDEEKDRRFSFCFVRRPLDFYRSFWVYRRDNGGAKLHKSFPLDIYWIDDFQVFVNNVLDAFPEGFVTRLYHYYVGENTDKVNFIGRQENLKEDLIKALTLAGEKFDKDVIFSHPSLNVSYLDKDRSEENRDLCRLNPETLKRIEDRERWVLDNFYSD